MKRKPASQPEGLKNPTARVLIAEVAPDADHIIQQLKKEPALLSRTVRQLIKHSARLIEVAPLIQKGKKRAETEAKTLGRHNQEKKRKAAADYQEYREIAERLIANNARLRRATQNSLAARIRKELLMQGRDVSVKTIARALPKK